MAWAGKDWRQDAHLIIIKCTSCHFVFKVMSDLWIARCPACSFVLPGDLKRFETDRHEFERCVFLHPLYKDERKKYGIAEPYMRQLI